MIEKRWVSWPGSDCLSSARWCLSDFFYLVSSTCLDLFFFFVSTKKMAAISLGISLAVHHLARFSLGR